MQTASEDGRHNASMRPGSIEIVTRYVEHLIMLAPITDEILERLVVAATTDAAADEVTPPLSLGTQWTQDRIDWLRNYHLTNRAVASGLGHERTWAVLRSGIVCGSVRLKATDVSDVFETGIWLTQTARGHGVGRAAMSAVIENEAEQGVRELQADTAAGNIGALSLLGNFGFHLSPVDSDGRVQARLPLYRKFHQTQ